MGPSLELGSLAARIIENTRLGVWVIDADSRTTFANAAMATLLGATREELIGSLLYDWMDDEGRRVAAENVERRKQGIGESHEFVFRRKNGAALWTSLTTDPFVDDAGQYAGAVAFVTDITEQRTKDTERERLWQMLEESRNEVYLFREGDLGFEYANRGALMNLGYTLEELRAMTPVDLKPLFTREGFLALVAPLASGDERRLVFETVHRRRDGTTYPVEVRLHRATGTHFFAIINDITERQRARQLLEASEARFRALIENSLDLIILGDAEGRFTFASPSVTTVLGYTPAEFIAKHPLEHIHPDDQSAALAALGRTPVANPVRPAEFRVRHRDGSWRVLSALGRNLLHDPAVRAVVMNARDVTAERALEEQLGQSRRLESIGKLAGGVAHDFNNILTTIVTCTDFLESAGLPAQALADVREIKEAGERAAELTSQLLAFARRRFIRPQSVDVGALVKERQRFFERVLGEHVELRAHLPTGLWPALADPTQVEQVLLNLAVNARDAMPRGGKLTIETANVTLDESYAATHPEVSPGQYVQLAVSDTGEGIPAEVLPHIFEPFFTTKGVGEGTGLGLATVYGIVKQSGGHIWVYSEPGHGTTFKVYLPRAESAPTAVAQPEPSPIARGSERLLVVEDEDAVRRVLVRSLEGAGYTVQAMGSPVEALAWARAAKGAFELLLTDVVMPGMSGKELASTLSTEFPHLKVLFMSGYTQNAIVHRGALDQGVELLAKPFSPGALRDRVRELLDRRGPKE